MRVELIDVDGHNFPNLPLMKISAYHKSRGDSVAWYNPLTAWVICKSCRISRRIEKCSLQKKCGAAGVDGSGACLGFGKEFDDEPIEQCKR